MLIARENKKSSWIIELTSWDICSGLLSVSVDVNQPHSSVISGSLHTLCTLQYELHLCKLPRKLFFGLLLLVTSGEHAQRDSLLGLLEIATAE